METRKTGGRVPGYFLFRRYNREVADVARPPKVSGSRAYFLANQILQNLVAHLVHLFSEKAAAAALGIGVIG